MRVLFDVNVLIAILDAEQVYHQRAQEWWAANRSAGWATCPLTENGFARIVSQSRYKNRITTTFAIDLLVQQVLEPDHASWPHDVSLSDHTLFDSNCILGPNQITDVYLLVLAVKNSGRLATLDRNVPLRAVRAAEPKHLVMI